MPKTSVARGAIGRASYDAVRKHVEQGKKTTEAFALVAEATGRSRATVQTAYYRIARSLPDGGGVKLRPRTGPGRGAKRATKASKRSRRASTGASLVAAGASRGSRSAETAVLARQLSNAAETLVAHVARLEQELARARADSKRLAQIERALKR